jgi:hypothetical protein
LDKIDQNEFRKKKEIQYALFRTDHNIVPLANGIDVWMVRTVSSIQNSFNYKLTMFYL